jgi:hypothetical protein
MLSIGTIVVIVDRGAIPAREYVGIITNLAADDRYYVLKVNHIAQGKMGETTERVPHPVRIDTGSPGVNEQYFIKSIKAEPVAGDIINKLAAKVEALSAKLAAVDKTANAAFAGIKTMNHASLTGEEMHSAVNNAMDTGKPVAVRIPGQDAAAPAPVIEDEDAKAK